MPVNIAYFFTTDPNSPHTIDQLCVSIGSILINRDVSREYTITIYSTEESVNAIKSRLINQSQPGCTIQIKNLEVKNIADRNKRLSQKLFALDRACKEFDKFIFIDADTIVLCNICELFDFDIHGYPLGGVEDTVQVVFRKTRSPGYINAGVLVCDSKELTNFLPEGFSPLYEESCNSRFHDQDAINRKIPHTLLPAKYNMIGWGNSDCKSLWKQNDKGIIHYASIRYEDLSRISSVFARSSWITYSNLILRTSLDKPVKKILLARKHRAFGDWIIFADVLKAINDTYPDIQVDVEANGNARTDILTECGCRYRLVANPDIKDYDGYDPHVLYNTNPVTPNKHIIVSALENTCSKIPILDIKDFVLINLVSPVVIPEDYKIPDGDYVIVPHYYTPLVSSRVKDYSQENYNRLVSLLSSRYKVFELNSGSVEYRYSTNDKSYSDSAGVITTKQLGETAKLLKHAKFCVLIENGMNHWACHNGARSYCIFKSPVHARPDSLRYNTMIPIECYNDESPEYVFSEIMKQEKK